eukprot:6272744-Prymnesium_polylepis.1
MVGRKPARAPPPTSIECPNKSSAPPGCVSMKTADERALDGMCERVNGLCLLTGSTRKDAAHEHGTRAGRVNDASGVPRKSTQSRCRHGLRVRHAG